MVGYSLLSAWDMSWGDSLATHRAADNALQRGEFLTRALVTRNDGWKGRQGRKYLLDYSVAKPHALVHSEAKVQRHLGLQSSSGQL